MASAPSLSPDTALDVWYKIGGAVGGFATALALLVAAIIGFFSFRQYLSQRETALESGYMEVFRQYTEVSDILFDDLTAPPDEFRSESFRRFLRSAAKIVHYAERIDGIAERSAEAFSAADYILLTQDIDSLKKIMPKWLNVLFPTVVEMDVQRHGFDVVRESLGTSLTEAQDAILKGLEAKLRSSHSLDVEGRSRIWAEIDSDLSNIFNYVGASEYDIIGTPEIFLKAREMQSFILLQESLEAVGGKIHQRALAAAGVKRA